MNRRTFLLATASAIGAATIPAIAGMGERLDVWLGEFRDGRFVMTREAA